MWRYPSTGARESGVALLTAIVLLAIFLMLGSAYLRYTMLEVDRVAFELEELQARSAARAGAYAAIGEIQVALSAGQEAPSEFEARFPIYKSMEQGKPVPDGNVQGCARVKVLDECARINLNHAPPRLLQAVFGIDLATARQIRRRLPGSDEVGLVEGQATDRRWAVSVDDFLDRMNDLLRGKGVQTDFDEDLLTVHSVADQTNPMAFINVNSAPALVMAAVLDVDVESARSVIAARPFSSLSALSAAAGKDAVTFTLRPALDAPDALPKELCFRSRCFRIVSTGALEARGSEGEGRAIRTTQVEAVVRFVEGNQPAIMYWGELRGEAPPAHSVLE